MSDPTKIVVSGLLSQDDLDGLGTDVKRIYRIADVPCFEELLRAIDIADRNYRRSNDVDGAGIDPD